MLDVVCARSYWFPSGLVFRKIPFVYMLKPELKQTIIQFSFLTILFLNGFNVYTTD